MAGERTLPGLGLTGFWTEGTDGWKPGMDTNLRILSVLTQLAVLSRVTALPGSPTQGMIYIVKADAVAHANEIAVYDDGAWNYIVPRGGFQAWVVDEAAFVFHDGTSWGALDTGGGEDPGGGDPGGGGGDTGATALAFRLAFETVARNPDLDRVDIYALVFMTGAGVVVPSAPSAGTAFSNDSPPSYEFGDNGVLKAFDGDAATFYRSGVQPTPAAPQTLGFLFNVATKIGKFSIQTAAGYTAPRTFKLQSAPAQTGPWTDLQSYGPITWVSSPASDGKATIQEFIVPDVP